MDDPVLLKARAILNLLNAATPTPTSPPKQKKQPKSPSPSPSKPRGVSAGRGGAGGVGEDESFHVSVIRGSSFVSTRVDVRNVLKKGSGSVVINDVEYQLSTRVGAEWSPNRIELSEDYAGETSTEAILIVKNALKRAVKKKIALEPVSTCDIRDAIRGLDDLLPSANDRVQEQQRSSAPPTSGVVERSKSSNNASRPRPGRRHGEPQRVNSEQALALVAPPVHSTGFGDLGMDAGSYLANLKQKSQEATAEQQRRAMKRIVAKQKQDAETRAKQEKDEQELKAAIRVGMEMKAMELREKTIRRVARIKSVQLQELEAKKLTSEIEYSKKIEAAAAAQTETYHKNMLKLRKETSERLRQIKAEETARKNAEDLLTKKKLAEISEARRRSHPVHHQQQGGACSSSLIRSAVPIRKARGYSPVVSNQFEPNSNASNVVGSWRDETCMLANESRRTETDQYSNQQNLESGDVDEEEDLARGWDANDATKFFKQDGDPDEWSDDSLGDEATDPENVVKQQLQPPRTQQNQRHNATFVPFLPTEEEIPDDLLSEITHHNTSPKKSNKRSPNREPVWKLRPIKIAPFIPIPPP